MRVCVAPTAVAAAAKLLQSCPTLCDPIDGSQPGSSAHGILQARVLEWDGGEPAHLVNVMIAVLLLFQLLGMLSRVFSSFSTFHFLFEHLP